MTRVKSTITTYEYNSGTRELNIPFDYLRRDFVVVNLGGDGKPLKLLTVGVDYTFNTKTSITVIRKYEPTEGYNKIIIRRITDASKRIVNYQDGSILNANELNTSQLQALHVAEEARDLASYVIGISDDGSLNAGGKRIENVGDAIKPTDALTFKSLNNFTQDVVIKSCSDVSFLRALEPTNENDRVWLCSHSGFGTKGSGMFQYDPYDVDTPDNDGSVIVTSGGKRWKRVNPLNSPTEFGAKADGVTDDTLAIQKLINSLKPYSTLDFMDYDYNVEDIQLTKPITIKGTGKIIINNVRIKTSNVNILFKGTLKAKSYPKSRGFSCVPYEDGISHIYNIRIEGVTFEDFFYATDFRAREYKLVSEKPVSRIEGLVIANCTSTATPSTNAGHFQHIGCTNVKLIGNSTYNGKNASSYNFINNNGYLIVSNNYDHNNDYASCEIENSSNSVIVSNNMFNKEIWIDDSSNVLVSSNIVGSKIYVTTQSFKVDTVKILGNTCSYIYCSKFGSTQQPEAEIANLIVKDNTINGSVTHGVYLDGSVSSSIIESNDFMAATVVNAISIVRKEDSKHTIRMNKANEVKSTLSGSDNSNIVEYGNIGFSVKGSRDSKTISNIMKLGEYLQTPLKVVTGNKYGKVGQSQGVSVAFDNDLKYGSSYRIVHVSVSMYNDRLKQMCVFSQNGVLYQSSSRTTLEFSDKFGIAGHKELAANVSLSAEIRDTKVHIKATNTSADFVVLTVYAELSNRHGTSY